MTSKLNRKQAEHVRAWLCHLISSDNLPDSFWSEMEELGLDRDVVADYVEKRYERMCVEMGQPSFQLWP